MDKGTEKHRRLRYNKDHYRKKERENKDTKTDRRSKKIERNRNVEDL
jgi:hypothetical protein